MSLYRSLYPEVEAKLRQGAAVYGQFHGSIVRDIFIEHARGRFAVDDHAGKLLLELRDAGEIEALERRPTVSQAAFAGLQIAGKAYYVQELGSWNAEHHYWRWLGDAPQQIRR